MAASAGPATKAPSSKAQKSEKRAWQKVQPGELPCAEETPLRTFVCDLRAAAAAQQAHLEKLAEPWAPPPDHVREKVQLVCPVPSCRRNIGKGFYAASAEASPPVDMPGAKASYESRFNSKQYTHNSHIKERSILEHLKEHKDDDHEQVRASDIRSLL